MNYKIKLTPTQKEIRIALCCLYFGASLYLFRTESSHMWLLFSASSMPWSIYKLIKIYNEL